MSRRPGPESSGTTSLHAASSSSDDGTPGRILASAATAAGARELYAALGDGTVLQSTDGCRSWDVRSSR